MLSVAEVARELGIGRNRAYGWIRGGVIPSIRDRGRIYVPRYAIEEFVARVVSGELAEISHLTAEAETG